MNRKIIAVTACAAGIAHTYMAAESLIKAGKKKGYNLKVETQGSIGAENVLTEKDIEEAVNKTKDFLNDLKKELGNIEYAIEIKEDIIYIKIEGEKAADLIVEMAKDLESISSQNVTEEITR